ncbi:FecCD family ABC transporter permease [Cellulosimicrobium marinum]|uniref:FecCD family ABC transporter permease n=1 Tax=Cellulosimicrobium marinum TaxID=1638992 RepID=UPI001E623299|nr:iron chelate uptake ABC transporter family permease subunit [Cellulosimicrobium marinum]MCB7137470.1 iron chelate uptake ABC transporter family permease subunit [Cellulosimicrobium marinum]
MTAPVTAHPEAAVARATDRLRAVRRHGSRRRAAVVAALAVALVVAAGAALVVGTPSHPLPDVLRVLAGQDVPGASYTVGQVRLPRTVTAVLAGAAFGVSGVIFQTMLRNALASPDIIGITAGASAAAVTGITVLGLSGLALSAFATVSGLVVAGLIAAVAGTGRTAGTRLILIGIGIAAMCDAWVSYQLLRADQWEVQGAMRWLTGSLSTAFWPGVPPLALTVAVVLPALAVVSRRLRVLPLGDDAATQLGVPVAPTRLLLVLGAVALAAVATATTGPIAFVAFLAGPIAHRLVPGGGTLLAPSALVGALLVVLADAVGQHAFSTTFPVGVVTAAIGAPYLIVLLVRSNRNGGSL